MALKAIDNHPSHIPAVIHFEIRAAIVALVHEAGHLCVDFLCNDPDFALSAHRVPLTGRSQAPQRNLHNVASGVTKFGF